MLPPKGFSQQCAFFKFCNAQNVKTVREMFDCVPAKEVDDEATATGTQEEVVIIFRAVRDDIARSVSDVLERVNGR